MMNATEYIGCKCHDQSWAEFHKEIEDPLQEYCFFLLQSVEGGDCNEKLIATSPDFGGDYRAIKSSLAQSRMDLTQAEKAVLFWQGVVPDSLMQESILQLRYGYIRKLIQRS